MPTNYPTNSIASLINNHPITHPLCSHSHSLRRKLIHIFKCCATPSLFHHNHHTPSSSTASTTSTDEPQQIDQLPTDSNLLRVRKMKLEEMKEAVMMLTEGKEVENAASEVRRLAKDDPFARETLAMLGAIPPLVGMLGKDVVDDDSNVAPLYALLNLSIGNDMNKAAIVKAGAVHKMLHIIVLYNGSPSNLVSGAIVANFLGLSALDTNKLVIGSSGAVPFLVKIVGDVDGRSSLQMKHDALRALYNLSISHLNILFILDTDLVIYLVNALGDMEVSEWILSILSNVVSNSEGQKALSVVPDIFPILVDVLNWNDAPGCQEKVLYVLLVMAYKFFGGRQAIIDAGAMSALLELTLVGSTLAQKRSSRIIECLSLDKGKRPSSQYNGGLSLTTALSAPMYGSSSTFSGSNWDHNGVEAENVLMSEEKKAVNQLVQQSLQHNMTRIVLRANLPQEFVPSDHFKTLTLSSTSKSLPF